jgi:hypothetical protein
LKFKRIVCNYKYESPKNGPDVICRICCRLRDY